MKFVVCPLPFGVDLYISIMAKFFNIFNVKNLKNEHGGAGHFALVYSSPPKNSTKCPPMTRHRSNLVPIFLFFAL